MVAHGSSHITQYIDIGYDRDRENCAALASILRGMNARLRNAPPGLPFILDAQTFRNTQNLTLDTDLAPFDLLGHISGAEDFNALYERSVQAEIEDVPVRIASLSDLMAMKRAADRPKDREYLMQLEALKKLKADAEG